VPQKHLRYKNEPTSIGVMLVITIILDIIMAVGFDATNPARAKGKGVKSVHHRHHA